MSTLQTLDRGLRVLQIVADHPRGILVADLAAALDVHRAVAYRLVATLEEHGYVTRLVDGRVRLGGAVLDLAARYAPQMRHVHGAVLADLAEASGAAAFLTVAEGEHCVAVSVAEPRSAVVRVGYRVGARHPLDRGAAGLAILGAMPARPGESERIREVRRLGYAVTHGELEPGATGIAAGFGTPSPDDGTWQYHSVGVVRLGDVDVAAARDAVLEVVARLRHPAPPPG